ncbi:hypothetical protein L5515_002448 [Caenorhabditis briggsae]|uniref:Uncharacterized protein n=1 Tax=Caenorhabditis briggsae TaxID=6238 RepID=A0AAE9E8R9_CAEBR|nr:hypothetical protein L5515_002448 [Caenorhabditis briggsae]
MKKGLPDEILKILEESKLDVIIKMEKFRLSNGTTYEKLKRERLGRTRTSKPNMEKLAPTDIFYKKSISNFAFTIGNKNIFKVSEKEKNLVYLLTGPFLGQSEKNFGIPDGAKSISFVHQGFEFASNNCMSFKPTFEVENPENCYMEYYFKSPDVQIAYWKEKDQAPRVAGVCWWFGRDSDEQYNLCTIFEIERDQLLEDIYKLRRELKNQAKSDGIAQQNTESLVNCPILKICETMEGEKRVQMRYELANREKLEENLKEIGEIEAVMDGLVEVVAQKIKGYLPFV